MLLLNNDQPQGEVIAGALILILKKTVISLLLLLVCIGLSGSGNAAWALGKRNQFGAYAGLNQLKERENLGMVFSGPGIGLSYSLTLTEGKLTAYYRPELSFATGFSHGITGYEIGFKPIDAAFVVKVLDTDRHTVGVGCSTGLSYHWQMYPYLHNSHLFAQAEVPLCLVVRYAFGFKGNMLTLDFENSIFGWAGQLPKHDPYAYSLSFSEFAVQPLRSLRFGSYGSNVASRLSVVWNMERMPGHAFGLGFSYRSIGKAEKHQKLTFSLIWQKRF